MCKYKLRTDAEREALYGLWRKFVFPRRKGRYEGEEHRLKSIIASADLRLARLDLDSCKPEVAHARHELAKAITGETAHWP